VVKVSLISCLYLCFIPLEDDTTSFDLSTIVDWTGGINEHYQVILYVYSY
jgi:hypothetical protein